MKPPQQSIAASTFLLLQAKSSVCRPPEQKPIAPTLPVAPGSERRWSAAASRSCTASLSGRPNMTGNTVLMSSGLAGPPRRQ